MDSDLVLVLQTAEELQSRTRAFEKASDQRCPLTRLERLFLSWVTEGMECGSRSLESKGWWVRGEEEALA